MAEQVWRKRVHDPDSRRRELAALQLLGPAGVRLVGVDGEDILLERVTPGTSAAALPDDQATTVIASALPRLWAPVPAACHLPTVTQECRALHDPAAVASLPAHLLEAAQRRLAELLASTSTAVVLHGDMHHGNLLWSQARQAWVAVDPHGVVGDPAYDVGPMLINPWEHDVAARAGRRLDILHGVLGIPRMRLAGWGLVRAVLAEAWMVQDTGRPDGRPLAVAEALLSEQGHTAWL